MSVNIRRLKQENKNNYFLIQSIENKADILKYLKENGKIYAYGANCFKDCITGTRIEESLNAYTDGVYIWHTDEIYHFEHYNLKLNDDFIEYVLAKTHGEKSRK